MDKSPPQGKVVALHVAPAATAAMLAVDHATALAGQGLEGDRYALAAGTFSTWPKDHELTLIEAEAIDAIRAAGIDLSNGRHRRNLTTRGVRLNDWVGQTFRVGRAVCRGTRLCPPCEHLRTLLDEPELLEMMKNRGGLRATILEGGQIAPGDDVALVAGDADLT